MLCHITKARSDSGWYPNHWDNLRLIRDDRIAAVGPAQQIRLPRAVRRVDGRGTYLLPGLADMHVHFTFPPELASETVPIQDRFALLVVANGITTVRNMWATTEVLALKRGIESGAVLGPTIYTAGSLFDGDPPIFPGGRACFRRRSPADALAPEA